MIKPVLGCSYLASRGSIPIPYPPVFFRTVRIDIRRSVPSTTNYPFPQSVETAVIFSPSAPSCDFRAVTDIQTLCLFSLLPLVSMQGFRMFSSFWAHLKFPVSWPVFPTSYAGDTKTIHESPGVIFHSSRFLRDLLFHMQGYG